MLEGGLLCLTAGSKYCSRMGNWGVGVVKSRDLRGFVLGG